MIFIVSYCDRCVDEIYLIKGRQPGRLGNFVSKEAGAMLMQIATQS